MTTYKWAQKEWKRNGLTNPRKRIERNYYVAKIKEEYWFDEKRPNNYATRGLYAVKRLLSHRIEFFTTDSTEWHNRPSYYVGYYDIKDRELLLDKSQEYFMSNFEDAINRFISRQVNKRKIIEGKSKTRDFITLLAIDEEDDQDYTKREEDYVETLINKRAIIVVSPYKDEKHTRIMTVDGSSLIVEEAYETIKEKLKK